MIRRKPLMATAIIAAGVVTACSETTAPNQLAQGLSAHRVYATCTFASVGAKDDRAFPVLGGSAVLFAGGTGSLGGVISFDGRNKYEMNMSSWTGLDPNGDGTPEAFQIVGTWEPINFVGSTIPWDLVFPVTGTPIDLDMNADGLNDFKVGCRLN